MKRMKENEILEYFSSLKCPSGRLKKWMIEELTPRYLFYDDNEITCSFCGNTDKRDKSLKLRTGKETVCPICGRKVIARHNSYGHKTFDRCTAIVPEKFNNGIILRYFEIHSSHAKDKSNPEIRITEVERNVFEKGKETLNFDKTRRWYDCPGTIHHQIPYAGKYELYTKNIDKVLKDTDWEYCKLTDAMEVIKGYELSGLYNVYRYLSIYEKSNLLEYLLKMNMNSLFRDLFLNPYRTCFKDLIFDFKSNKVHGILGITKEQLKTLNDEYDNIRLLSLYQAGYSIEDAKKALDMRMDGFDMDKLKKALKYSTKRILSYIEKNDYDFNLYIDYLALGNELQYDFNNPDIAFPSDLMKAHEVQIQLRKVRLREKDMQEARKNNKKYAKLKKKMIEDFGFSSDGICIVVPDSTMAIAKEGQTLHHCVGTYIERVAKGETVILFVRNENKKNKSFFTMEVRNGEVIQCRGLQNCNMTEQVKKFVETFKRERLHIVA